MCDFSCYNGISDDWLAIEKALPRPSETETELDLIELRRLGNLEREAISARAMKVWASRVHMQDYSIPTRDGAFIEARSYRPVNLSKDAILPLYIHLHGGGFVVGTLASEDATCSRIACGSGVVVLNVNYRGTPEYTYPVPWNDSEDAVEWAFDNVDELGGDEKQVILGGISAGAWIASSLTLEFHLCRDTITRPPLAGQVLMIPCVAHVDCYEPQMRKMKHHSVSSYKENEMAPLLPVSDVRYFTYLLDIPKPDPRDIKLNPGNATPAQVKGLPPTVLGIAGLDPLRDEGLLYGKMLTEVG